MAAINRHFSSGWLGHAGNQELYRASGVRHQASLCI